MPHIKKSISLPITLLAITLILLLIAHSHPQWVEQYYATKLYWLIVKPLSSLSALVPFSLSDIFYIILILWLPITVVLLIIRKIAIKTALVRLLQLVAYLFVAFYFLWGFNYYRDSTKNRLNLHLKNQDKTEAFRIAFIKTIEEANYYRQQVADSVDLAACDKSINETYKKLQHKLHIKYWETAKTTKIITFSNLYAKAGILGVYGPFFGEVHINKYFTKWGYPITRAHEMAHRFGLASEGDANFYAWYICNNSNNNWNRYCARIFALQYFISESIGLENRQQIINSISNNVIDDIYAKSNYWQKKMDVKVRKAAQKANDIYLKSNNVERGVQDYGEVLELIVACINNA